jgi:hypothetical protein
MCGLFLCEVAMARVRLPGIWLTEKLAQVLLTLSEARGG